MISFRRLTHCWMRHKLLVIEIVLILALGLGANIAIFSVYNAAFVQLPFEDAGAIAVLTTNSVHRDRNDSFISALDMDDLRAGGEAFAGTALYDSGTGVVVANGIPERVSLATVSGNLFSLLGVHPQAGSLFPASDGRNDIPDAIISDHLWRTMFSGSSEALNKDIKVGDGTFMVRGVLPPGFKLLENADVWIRLRGEEQEPRGARHYVGLARIKQGRSLAQANAELHTISKRLQEQYPDTNSGLQTSAVTLRSYLSHNFRSSFAFLFMTAVLVLTIAVFNVTNLLGVYLQSTRKEQAVELALGCSREKIRNRLVMEFLLLAIFAGSLGLVIAEIVLKLVMKYAPAGLELRHHYVDLNVYGFAMIAAVLTGVICTLMSFASVSRANIAEVIKGSSGGSAVSFGFHSWSRLMFLVFEVGMCVVLLTSAGLFAKSFLLLESVDAGFNSSGLLTGKIQLPPSHFRDHNQQALFWTRLLEDLGHLPKVQGAGIMTGLPLSGAHMNFRFTADPNSHSSLLTGLAEYKALSSNAFQLLGIPLRSGRYFEIADDGSSVPVVIINETMARTIFAGEDPLGRRIVLSYGDKKPREIVGVVGDVKYSSLAEKVKNQVYVPYSQNPWPFMTVILRTKVAPITLVPLLRQGIVKIDRELPLTDVRTMDDIVYSSMAQGRFAGILISCFGVLALILAASGVYGVISFAVSQRSREIAIRIALGAPRQSVLKLFLTQSLTVLGAGAFLGLLTSWFTTKLFQSLLYKVNAGDPEVTFSILVVLGAVGTLACLFPVARATRIDPGLVIRAE